MTATSDTDGLPATALGPEGLDPSSTERVKLRGRLLRLANTMLFATGAVAIANGAVGNLLVPLQIQQFDAENKVALLAVASTIGAAVGLVMQPVAGMLSDGTAARIGDSGCQAASAT